jgi:hypothetical protein
VAREEEDLADVSTRQQTSADVSIRQHRHTSAYVTSVYVSICGEQPGLYAVLSVVAREEDDLADEGREHSGAAAQKQHVACLM